MFEAKGRKGGGLKGGLLGLALLIGVGVQMMSLVASAVRIDAVSPVAGGTAGGDYITITGEEFLKEVRVEGFLGSYGRFVRTNIGIVPAYNIINRRVLRSSDILNIEGEEIVQIAEAFQQRQAIYDDLFVTASGKLFKSNYSDGYSFAEIGQDFTNEKIVAVETSGSLTGALTTVFILTETGKVLAYGSNSYGQFGLGDKVRRDEATDISSIFGGEKVTKIRTSGYNVMALTESGKVFTWGQNNRGVLGDGTTMERLSPVEITGAFGGEEVVDFSILYANAAALTASGRLFVWGVGGNYNGFLGTGSGASDQLTPLDITGRFGGETVTEMAVSSESGRRIMVLTNAGRVLIWGTNNNAFGGLTNSLNYVLEPLDITDKFSGAVKEIGLGDRLTVFLESGKLSYVDSGVLETKENILIENVEQLYFGETAATEFEIVDTTTIKAFTPAHAAGEVSVRAVLLDGSELELIKGYRYKEEGDLKLSQIEGGTAGGYELELEGVGFLGMDTQMTDDFRTSEGKVIDFNYTYYPDTVWTVWEGYNGEAIEEIYLEYPLTIVRTKAGKVVLGGAIDDLETEWLGGERVKQVAIVYNRTLLVLTESGKTFGLVGGYDANYNYQVTGAEDVSAWFGGEELVEGRSYFWRSSGGKMFRITGEWDNGAWRMTGAEDISGQFGGEGVTKFDGLLAETESGRVFELNSNSGVFTEISSELDNERLVQIYSLDSYIDYLLVTESGRVFQKEGSSWTEMTASFGGARIKKAYGQAGRVFVVMEDGRVFVWGRNTFGVLALDETFTDVYSPTPIDPAKFDNQKIEEMRVIVNFDGYAGGPYYFVAAKAEGGEWYVWAMSGDDVGIPRMPTRMFKGEEITGVVASDLKVVISTKTATYALRIGQGGTQMVAKNISYIMPRRAQVASIRVGDVEVTDFEIIDNTRIRLRMPAHVSGWVPVTLVDINGQSWSVQSGFTYMEGGSLPSVITNPNTEDRVLIWLFVALFGTGLVFMGCRRFARRRA